jgi:hypothetical protein
MDREILLEISIAKPQGNKIFSRDLRSKFHRAKKPEGKRAVQTADPRGRGIFIKKADEFRNPG